MIGAIIASIGGFYYLYETITGKSKPNRVTWLLWGIFPMIVFAAQQVQGVEGVSWVTFTSGVTPLLIFAVSFVNKKAYWKTRPLDYWCMAGAGLGILLWAITNDPNLAIIFIIAADIAAALPTVIKAYKHPETESWIAFAISTFGFILSVFTIKEWTFETYAFAVYLVLLNGLLFILSARKSSKDLLQIETA